MRAFLCRFYLILLIRPHVKPIFFVFLCSHFRPPSEPTITDVLHSKLQTVCESFDLSVTSTNKPSVNLNRFRQQAETETAEDTPSQKEPKSFLTTDNTTGGEGENWRKVKIWGRLFLFVVIHCSLSVETYLRAQ